MGETLYTIGTDQQQAWMKKNCFPPRGYGYSEPGTYSLDATEVAAYNVAKSFYQVYPEVWNIDYIEKETGIKPDDIKDRLKRMYDEHLIMFVMNPNVGVYGWGLYYWVVKLKDGTDPKVKAEFAKWYQNKDDICTGYLAEGDFDFFNGNHMRVLDNLLADVIQPWKDRPEVEYVHLCPIRADVRESLVNQWDVPKDRYRKFIFGEEQKKKFLDFQTLFYLHHFLWNVLQRTLQLTLFRIDIPKSIIYFYISYTFSSYFLLQYNIKSINLE